MHGKTPATRITIRPTPGNDPPPIVTHVRAGHPVARLVAFDPSRKAIAPPGGMAGEIHLADDFDAPLDELFEVLEFGPSADEP